MLASKLTRFTFPVLIAASVLACKKSKDNTAEMLASLQKSNWKVTSVTAASTQSADQPHIITYSFAQDSLTVETVFTGDPGAQYLSIDMPMAGKHGYKLNAKNKMLNITSASLGGTMVWQILELNNEKLELRLISRDKTPPTSGVPIGRVTPDVIKFEAIAR